MIESDIHARRRKFAHPRRLEGRAKLEIPVSPDVVLAGQLDGQPGRAHKGIAILVDVPGHGRAHGLSATRAGELTRALGEAGVATLRLGLLTKLEQEYLLDVFDRRLLAQRLQAATAWLREQAPLGDVPIAYLAAGAGAEVAIQAARRAAISACVLARPEDRLSTGAKARKAPCPLLVIVDDDAPGTVEPRAPQDAGGGASPGARTSHVSRLAAQWLSEQLSR